MIKRKKLLAVAAGCAAVFCLAFGLKFHPSQSSSLLCLDDVESLTFCEGSASAYVAGKQLKVSILCDGEGRCKKKAYGVTIECSGKRVVSNN